MTGPRHTTELYLYAIYCSLIYLLRRFKFQRSTAIRTIANSIYPSDNANQEAALASVERCIEDIRNWMLNDKLKLNDDKTEFMIIGTSQQLVKYLLTAFVLGLQLSLLCRLQGTWAHALIPS